MFSCLVLLTLVSHSVVIEFNKITDQLGGEC